jgi:hypothetical protein
MLVRIVYYHVFDFWVGCVEVAMTGRCVGIGGRKKDVSGERMKALETGHS